MTMPDYYSLMLKNSLPLQVLLVCLVLGFVIILFGMLSQICLKASSSPFNKTNKQQRKIKTVKQDISKELTALQANNVSTPLKAEDPHTHKYQIGEYAVQTRSFCLHKKGGSPSEYEDRSEIVFQEDACLRIAVADGTTESLFSDIWADLLVKGYGEQGAALFEDPSLWSIHKEFIHQTYQQIAEMPEARHWAMYGKLERGTHATLAAVEFSAGKSVKMSVVGDSCIFWMSDGKIEMWPELNVEDFGISPDSISHIPETWQNLRQKVRTKEISFEQNCQFVICTDAIACWLVEETQEKNNFSAWHDIIKLPDEVAFNQLIEELRDSKKIRNDDVTLVIGDATFNV
jgi:hypothetical protein